MQATAHPTDESLSAYGLGKLDGPSAEAVQEHLGRCEDCRRRVSEVSSDSFLGRFRAAQQPPGGTTFAGSIADGMPSLIGSKAPPSADTLPPGLADHPDYQIRRELGRGGMGVVYLAHNTMMGRDEVLKVIGRNILERPEGLERFQREIKAVSKLRHPNIVVAHAAFRLDGGLVFAMEYVEGLDLARLVKAKGPLPVAHAAYFIHQAALGLQHAHERGMVHRDIKPHNLMLTHDGKARVIKVLDFGLAKATREEKVDGGLTSEGQALGTPDYIAPEQIVNAPDVDTRADIYSLGGTLFYLLTGRPPFVANSLYDLYQAHMSRDIEPLNLLRPEVPAELAALVSKMMAKDPKRRFQTPGEVAQALKPFFKPGVEVPRPGGGPTQFGTTDARALKVARKLAMTEPSPSLLGPTGGPKTLAGAPDLRWDDLIDARATGPEPAPPIVEVPTTLPRRPRPAARPRRRARRPWIALAVASLLCLPLIAWLAGVIKLSTPEGTIVLEGVPNNSEIRIDGEKITFTLPGGGGPVKVRAVPGQHKIEVERDGFKTFGETVSVQSSESEVVTVRLEPLVSDRVGKEATNAPASPVETIRVPSPSGGPRVGEAADPFQVGSVWRTEPGDFTFTVLDRQGEQFKALFVVDRQIRELHGTIKEGRLRWLARDVKVIEGKPGGDNEGEIKGDEIAMSWSDPGGPVQGRFKLRLKGPAAGGPVASNEGRAGFVPLFNGKDLAGWTIDSGTRNSWRVEDGNLVVTGPGDWRKSGFVLSDREFSDFHLRFEFKPAAGSNSGLTFRSMLDEFVGRLAHPIQIELFDADKAGIANGSLIWSSSIRNEDMRAPDRPVQMKPGDSWNTMELEVQGDSLRASVNGKAFLLAHLGELAARPNANPALKRRSGRIGFQSHTGTVRFRNIEVKELTGAGDPPPMANGPAAPRHPADAKEFQGKHYKVFAEQVTWHEADARCRALGGHLAIVPGPAVNRALTLMAKEAGLGGVWLGATDEKAEGRWIWVDGAALRYSNWDLPNKQPNNKQGIEHYLVLMTRFDGTWSDQPDDGRQEHPGFICQWDD